MIKAEFSQEFYESLTEEQRKEISINGVDINGIDYSGDSIWIDLKYTASRAYKKLKEREYNLRNRQNG